ncbi:MAG: hypothetical protein H6Q89_845 [Myxococcaceae bacterium]|nr:hypothetical protein [Myxococcaceae bacterium]
MQIAWPKPNRKFSTLDGLGLVGLIGLLVARFVPVAVLIPYWGCSFRDITGFPCPGCGLTRVADRFAHFNFYGAFIFAIAVIWSFLHLAFKVPTPEVTLDDRDWTRLRNAALVLFALNYVFVVIQHRHPFL